MKRFAQVEGDAEYERLKAELLERFERFLDACNVDRAGKERLRFTALLVDVERITDAMYFHGKASGVPEDAADIEEGSSSIATRLVNLCHDLSVYNVEDLPPAHRESVKAATDDLSKWLR